MKLLASLLLVCALGIGALAHLTQGFSALTSETARRNDVAASPRLISDVSVLTPSNAIRSLHDVLHQDGRVAIVNFIYTRCVTLCLAMGSEYQQLQQAILDEGLQDKVRLLSISFDPTDSADRLQRYSHMMKADPAVWQFVTMMPGDERQRVLDDFGIIVIPAPFDEYEHNAAYHVVTAEPRLRRIVDYGEPILALSHARQALERVRKAAP